MRPPRHGLSEVRSSARAVARDDLPVVAAAGALLTVTAALGGLWTDGEVPRAANRLSAAVALSLDLLGPTAFAARLPGVLAGVATVWLALRLGGAWFGRGAGVLAALALATSPLTLLQSGRLLGAPGRTLLETAAVFAVARLPTSARWGPWQGAVVFAIPLLGLALEGGTPAAPGSLDVAVRQVGLAAFPWAALLPGAIAALAIPRHAPAGGPVAAAWCAGGFLACAVAAATGRPPVFTALPAAAIAAGAALAPAPDGALSAARGRVALAIGSAALVLMAEDVLRSPDGLLGAALPGGAAPPGAGPLPFLYVACLAGWAAAAGATVLGRSVPPAAMPMAAVGMACALSLGWLGPASLRLSRRGAVDAWRAAAHADEPLLAYKLDGPLFHAAGAERVHTLGALRARMAGPGRVFALVPRGSLGTLDHHLRSALGRHVPVLHDGGGQVLLVSNHLAPGEQDASPISAAVTAAPPLAPGQRLHARFDDGVALLGAALSARDVHPGGALDVTLHFHARAAPTRRWRVIVQAEDGPRRLALEGAEHEPVGGVYPFDRWVAGDHVADRFRVRLPRGDVRPGWYRLYVGLAAGALRAGVASGGEEDGGDRVAIGEIRVIGP